MGGSAIRRRNLVWLGSGLLIAGFAVDLHLDTRERDLFSWMDPYQYYEFSLGVVEGRERLDGFEIPSTFPFLVMPLIALEPSIPAALWVNVVSLLLLLGGVHGLCRELSLRTPSPLVAALVLSSPLLLGLSRTLYVEFTLTALACIVFLSWLRFLRAPDVRSGLAFGLLFGLAFMTKITFPLFLVAPVVGAVLGRISERRDEALMFVAAAVLPIVIAVALHASAFSRSLGYYVNLVSVSLPFMYLMGPPEVWSWSSATYYAGEIGRSLLLLLTPFLGLAAVALWRRSTGFSLRDLASPQAALWLWLLGPLVLLIAHPLKEPRHVAPSVVPAVLLLVLGIEAVPRRAARAALLTAALALALIQYLGVTSGLLQTPYFMDGSLHYGEIRTRMAEATDREAYRRTPPELRELHWRYNQNVAIAGFPPNESLALVWQGFPGVVFDLDTFEDPARFYGDIPFERFEDLFFLAGINAYNRRCGWRWYHPTLSREVVIDHADFVLLNETGAPDPTGQFPEHLSVATIERDRGRIRILKSRRATTPYRALYARGFLERNPDLPAEETRVVAKEMLIAALLAANAPAARDLLREFPVLREPGVTERNIYWIGGYPSMLGLARERLAMLSGDGDG